MKPLTLLVLLALSTSLRADESAPLHRPSILVKLHVYSGKMSALQPLMRNLLRPTEQPHAIAELKELIKSGAVELTGEVTGETLLDEKFEGFQGETWKSGISFEQPEVLMPKADAKTAAPSSKEPTLGFGYATTGFASDKLGTSLTLATALSEESGQYIVNASCTRKWLVKWDDFEIGRLPNNEKILIKQPRIGEAASSGTFAVASGEWIVLSFHSVSRIPARSELVLLELTAKSAPSK
jgi:hypothetical protein